MILTKEKHEEFERVVELMIACLNANCHPHTKIIIDHTTAELVEGVCTAHTEKYLKD